MRRGIELTWGFAALHRQALLNFRFAERSVAARTTYFYTNLVTNDAWHRFSMAGFFGIFCQKLSSWLQTIYSRICLVAMNQLKMCCLVVTFIAATLSHAYGRSDVVNIPHEAAALVRNQGSADYFIHRFSTGMAACMLGLLSVGMTVAYLIQLEHYCDENSPYSRLCLPTQENPHYECAANNKTSVPALTRHSRPIGNLVAAIVFGAVSLGPFTAFLYFSFPAFFKRILDRVRA